MKALHRKENINKAKTQPMEQGKILANNVTNKGIISQYTNSSYNSIYKRK